MTAEKIREYVDPCSPGYEPSDEGFVLNALVRMTGEIAAQLAELNATLRFREAQAQICHCLDHQSSRIGTVVAGITFCDTCGKPWGVA